MRNVTVLPAPALSRAVTLTVVSEVAGVPLIAPLDELIDIPAGSPVAEKVTSEPAAES
jgi:hypothetical protein